MNEQAVLEQMPIPLLSWYREHARVLPWRADVTPYRVWVSEIMLQQTRVTAVLGYFARFMEALPTVEDLAAVSEERLLKLWEGLGYYSRVRNMQKAARHIVSELGGVFPRRYQDLLQLNGVGDYTAAAIASIAFDEARPAVDGNLLRVVARLTADHDDITTPAMKRKVKHALEQVIPLRAPGAFNQAMMDLGATICLPNGAPLCESCPLLGLCLAHAKGEAQQLPVRAPKKARRVEERDVFLFVNGDEVALRQRESKGLLAGLWEFPALPTEQERPPREPFGLSAPEPHFAGRARHIFTHIEWHMRVFIVNLQDKTLPCGWVWATRTDVETRYPIPSAFDGLRPSLETYWSGGWQEEIRT